MAGVIRKQGHRKLDSTGYPTYVCNQFIESITILKNRHNYMYMYAGDVLLMKVVFYMFNGTTILRQM